MKLTAFNYPHSTRFFFGIVVIVFLLEGCCLPPGYQATKKSCNCKDGPVYANKNKTLPPSDIEQGVLSSASESNHAFEKKEFQPTDLTLQHISQIKMEDLFVPRKTNFIASEKKLPLGIKAITTSIIGGPTISFKSSKEDYGSSNHKHKPGAGVVLGVGTTYYFSENFAVNTSLLFKSNNASEELSYTIPGDPGGPGGGTSETKTKYSYSYLSVPVLAQIKLSDQLIAVVGPEINYLVGASSTPSGNGEKNKITDNSVRAGVGAQAGLRYEFPNSPLGIQLLYDQRISRLNKKTETMDYVPGGGGSSYETPAWNMKSIQVGVTCQLCELMKGKR
jgi:hypothetical protein